MNDSFSLQQISRTGNLDSNLISRQIKLNLMAEFMRMKYENPKLKQSEVANHLGYSTSTLQRYRNEINLFLPYRIQRNNTKKGAKTVENTSIGNSLHRDPDVKRPQMTSKRPQTNHLKIRKT